MSQFDFNQAEGLLLIGLPEKNIPLIRALSEKLGEDMATVIAKALLFMAQQVLSDHEKKILAEKMK